MILLRILVISVQLILLGLVPAASLTPIYRVAAALARALELDSGLADPEARVAALAMERSEADRLTDLLRRHAAPAESGTIVPDSESP